MLGNLSSRIVSWFENGGRDWDFTLRAIDLENWIGCVFGVDTNHHGFFSLVLTLNNSHDISLIKVFCNFLFLNFHRKIDLKTFFELNHSRLAIIIKIYDLSYSLLELA